MYFGCTFVSGGPLGIAGCVLVLMALARVQRPGWFRSCSR
jgi:hypothetical protein